MVHHIVCSADIITHMFQKTLHLGSLHFSPVRLQEGCLPELWMVARQLIIIEGNPAHIHVLRMHLGGQWIYRGAVWWTGLILPTEENAAVSYDIIYCFAQFITRLLQYDQCSAKRCLSDSLLHVSTT